MKKESLRNMLQIGVGLLMVGLIIPMGNQGISISLLIAGGGFTFMSLVLSYLEGE